ncbi:Uncharacterized protein GBIM_07670 [Gryllus bimaculatus]|nr:Uncharacterized protein GBIM_07670 [Gryllus bimaculatus]
MGQNVKCKWQNLRDTYRKEFKKETAPSLAGASNSTKWKYSTIMSFLRDTLSPSHIVSNTTEDDHSVFIPVSVDISSPASPGSSSQTFSRAVTPPSNVAPPTLASAPYSDVKLETISNERRKRRLNAGEEAMKKLMRLEEERMEEIKRMSLRKEERDDEDYHFLMSLLPHMRNLPGRLKLKTRTKMQNILLEALDELETD